MRLSSCEPPSSIGLGAITSEPRRKIRTVEPDLQDDLVDVARAAAAVANYCDHAEHNEFVDAAWVLDAGTTIRAIARRIADREGIDLREAYARRLDRIEGRNVQRVANDFAGGAAVRAAATWLDLQAVQAKHDNLFHPDVVGLHKAEQLRHYALHLAKLTGALAEMLAGSSDREDFLARRLPDLLLFGLKLPTVMGHRLPETPALRRVEASVLAGR